MKIEKISYILNEGRMERSSSFIVIFRLRISSVFFFPFPFLASFGGACRAAIFARESFFSRGISNFHTSGKNGNFVFEKNVFSFGMIFQRKVLFKMLQYNFILKFM